MQGAQGCTYCGAVLRTWLPNMAAGQPRLQQRRFPIELVNRLPIAVANGVGHWQVPVMQRL